MDLLVVILWSLVGFAVFRGVAPRYTPEEQRWMGYAYGMHVLFALLHVVVVRRFLGGGDMFWYHRAGSELADLWMSNPGEWTGELVKLTLRQKAVFPFWVHGAGGDNSTGAMFGLSAWLMLICGKSLYGACVLLSVLNFFSRLLMYDVFRRVADESIRRYLVWALLLLPSAVFWTGGMIKESVAMAGMGVAVLGAYLLAEKSAFLRGVALIAAGGFTAYLVKPYVLFPFFIAVPVWYLVAKFKREASGAALLLTPLRVVLFIALLVVGLGTLAVAVPSLSVETLGDELASVQASGARVSGGSNYALVDAEKAQAGERAQISMAPLGFVFALTRPWPFEAKSVQLMVATLETTTLVILLCVSVRRIGVVRWLKYVTSEPWLLFCAAYVLIFGVAVGLGSTNVGSLSRYRVPMMGYYAMMVAYTYALSKGADTPPVPVASVAVHVRRTGRDANGRRRPLRLRNRNT